MPDDVSPAGDLVVGEDQVEDQRHPADDEGGDHEAEPFAETAAPLLVAQLPAAAPGAAPDGRLPVVLFPGVPGLGQGGCLFFAGTSRGRVLHDAPTLAPSRPFATVRTRQPRDS